jgi:hypothetical protein
MHDSGYEIRFSDLSTSMVEFLSTKLLVKNNCIFFYETIFFMLISYMTIFYVIYNSNKIILLNFLRFFTKWFIFNIRAGPRNSRDQPYLSSHHAATIIAVRLPSRRPLLWLNTLFYVLFAQPTPSLFIARQICFLFRPFCSNFGHLVLIQSRLSILFWFNSQPSLFQIFLVSDPVLNYVPTIFIVRFLFRLCSINRRTVTDVFPRCCFDEIRLSPAPCRHQHQK